jgi:hypothetical protein
MLCAFIFQCMHDICSTRLNPILDSNFFVTSAEYEACRPVILSILLPSVPSQVVNRRFPAEEARV